MKKLENSCKCNIELFKSYREKQDIKTRNKIVENNLGYVKQIANYYSTKTKENFEDLFQIGVIGLIKAVETYDISKGIKFTPFALPKIRGEILHWLRDKGHLIRIPPKIQELHQKIKKYSEINKVSYEKAAKELGISRNAAKELSEIYQQNFNPLVEDIKETSAIVELSIQEIISILPKEQYIVILYRFLEEMTLKDTANQLQLKTSDIKKIEKQAIENLQKEFLKNL